MDDHECVIGLLYQNDNIDLCNLSSLKEHIQERKEFNVEAKKYNMPYLVMTEWTLRDYADKRISTDLTRFDFCPYCGKKIDWKEIKKQDG